VKPSVKNYLFLILIYFALIGLGYLFTHLFAIELKFLDLIILLTGALIISVISSSVFFSGQKTSEKKGVLRTLTAVGIKFLLFLALLGIFALIKKDLSWHFLVAFFVIYLSFTFYLLTTFVRVLKSKNKAKPDDKGNEIY
jgi:hypothetical protein